MQQISITIRFFKPFATCISILIISPPHIRKKKKSCKWTTAAFNTRMWLISIITVSLGFQLFAQGYKEFTLTWSRSFTLSMGATAVLEMAAAIPPAKKSLAKEIACSLIFSCYQPPSSYSVGGVEMAESYLEVRGFKEAVREKKRELRFFSAIGRLWE